VSIQRRLALVAAAVFALLATWGASAQSAQEQALVERIRPVGEVCLEGDSACAAPVAAVASGPRTGEQVYGAACVACHDTGAGGAPKTGVAADWADRIAQGADTMLQHAIAGFTGSKGMMPPRGTCMNCSDEEIRLAVEYIVSKSQ